MKKKKNDGCKGGYVTVAFDYIKKKGLVDHLCPALKE